MGKLHELSALGQSVWFDYIRRSATRGGDLAALVESGVCGVSASPSTKWLSSCSEMGSICS